MKNDGTVVAWGDNALGETNVPAYLKSVVAIAAGNAESVALEQNPTAPMPPAIWWLAPGRAYAPGQSVLLLPYVTGSLPLQFRWFFNGAPLTSQTKQWLVLNSLQTSQAGNYCFIVSNNYGSVTSAVVVVSETPEILTQPASQSVVLSNNATFTVSGRRHPAT